MWQWRPVRNLPRFIAFIGETQSQYCVLVEQKIMSSTHFSGCFIHNVFLLHLGYPTSAENVYFFLQDYVLAYPDSYNRRGPYLATASDINVFHDLPRHDQYSCIIISYYSLATLLTLAAKRRRRQRVTAIVWQFLSFRQSVRPNPPGSSERKYAFEA